jgi:hypothetical protein
MADPARAGGGPAAMKLTLRRNMPKHVGSDPRPGPGAPPGGHLSPGKHPGREGGAVIPPLWASPTPPFLIFWGSKIGIHFPAVSPGNVVFLIFWARGCGNTVKP